MYYISNELWFPDVEMASEDGILAVGGDLSVNRLMLAYESGIFPWFEDGQQIMWWSPDPRMILYPSKFKVSKSLRKVIEEERFEVTFNTSFSEVITNCARINRKDQGGTWITNEMITAYNKLHEMERAISVEVWQKEILVGGLYGIDLPNHKVFCGESMFSHESDSSKVGFYYLAQFLKEKEYNIIDCQMYTAHLHSLGAEQISRCRFMEILNEDNFR
jgi:leucyl/phenylalanyl-tRNA--protein transferase